MNRNAGGQGCARLGCPHSSGRSVRRATSREVRAGRPTLRSRYLSQQRDLGGVWDRMVLAAPVALETPNANQPLTLDLCLAVTLRTTPQYLLTSVEETSADAHPCAP